MTLRLLLERRLGLGDPRLQRRHGQLELHHLPAEIGPWEVPGDGLIPLSGGELGEEGFVKSSIHDSIQSHLICIAAERSRHEHTVVDVDSKF